MKVSFALLRFFFVILTLCFMTAYMTSLPIGPMWQKTMIGIGLGVLVSGLLISLEFLFKKYSLRAFYSVIIGLFTGYLLGLAVAHILQAFLTITQIDQNVQPQTIYIMKTSVFLLGTYLGAFLTLHFIDEVQVNLPFLKLSKTQTPRKDFLLDGTALSDTRIIDLATTGILDHAIIVPSFLIKELQSQAEIGEETIRLKAKRSLDTLKKLETLPTLYLRYDETQLSEGQDLFAKLLRLARMLDSNILSGDLSQAQLPFIEGIQVINLHTLSNALKPLMQAGESMRIKIQRFGKEPNQGVGYLEDGTMVVVNGGGDFIGETIEVQVLSVKHTSSGRMIFCNTMEEIPARGNKIEV